MTLINLLILILKLKKSYWKNEKNLRKMTQPVWTLTDKEKIKKTLELIQDFEDSGSSKHYKANAQKMRIMLDAIKKTLES